MTSFRLTLLQCCDTTGWMTGRTSGLVG